jgi:hypothetical protein
LVAIVVAGLTAHLKVHEFTMEAVALSIGSALGLVIVLRWTQVWEVVIILGTAETEIAEKFAKASEHYRENPVALHLRAMNMVYEGLRQKGSMIIVPSTAVETMGLGALGGLTAFGKGGENAPPPDVQPVDGLGGDSGPAASAE